MIHHPLSKSILFWENTDELEPLPYEGCSLPNYGYGICGLGDNPILSSPPLPLVGLLVGSYKSVSHLGADLCIPTRGMLV